MPFLKRNISPAILEASKFFRVIVVSGPRQTGKTTLCKHLFPDYTYYNLEDIALRTSISEDPKRFLASCGQKVIIDEAQNLPDLFSYIQLTVDNELSRRFVLTGSNNLSLMENITQSLAGRAALFTLLPFALSETPGEYIKQPTDSILLKGLFPRVVAEDIPAELFYRNYYSTYIERDVRMIRQITDLTRFQHLIKLIAGRVGSECNMSALANETGISSPTVKSWISVLQTSYILTILPPYYTNISKRLAKSPKIYFIDTGLLCYLLGITTVDQLAVHPLRGAVFENLIVIEMLKNRYNMGLDSNLYFYRESSGREVDIIQTVSSQLRLWEVKSSSTYNSEFRRNLDYLKSLLGDTISSAKIIYDGDPIPPDIYNFRQIPD
ncbi:MAG: ATP-binding protein [Muribaculaceae bacterium]|nr:ATP-binding protein [Muribaculaceae bacterium]